MGELLQCGNLSSEINLKIVLCIETDKMIEFINGQEIDSL